MTDFFTDDGCLVVVNVQRAGSEYPLQHAYAVAEKDHNVARNMIEKTLPDGETIVAVTTLPATVMEGLKLAPGKYQEWPAARG